MLLFFCERIFSSLPFYTWVFVLMNKFLDIWQVLFGWRLLCVHNDIN